MSINRVVIVGHLGGKPELKTSANGHSYTNLNIATSRAIPGEGEQNFETTTDWHTVTVWGKRGVSCAEYLVKGQLVAVEGYLSTFNFNNKESDPKELRKNQRVAVTAKSVEFLSKPRDFSS